MNAYIFMPEIVGIASQNLSHWLEEYELLTHKEWFRRELDVEKTLKLEKDLRVRSGPTLALTMTEMLKEAKWHVSEKLLQKLLDEHYDLAKSTDKFYEFISEPYQNDYCIRIIGICFKSGFWEGWREVTVQITQQHRSKIGKLKHRVLTLGFHVEKVPSTLKVLFQMTEEER